LKFTKAGALPQRIAEVTKLSRRALALPFATAEVGFSCALCAFLRLNLREILFKKHLADRADFA
jgi:hypothetical protein